MVDVSTSYDSGHWNIKAYHRIFKYCSTLAHTVRAVVGSLEVKFRGKSNLPERAIV